MNDLSTLPDMIRADLARRDKGRAEWIEGTLALCQHLAEAKAQFPSTEAFGRWLVDNKLDSISHHQRAAAIKMAGDIPLARTILEATERVSLELIWQNEMQPRLAAARNSAGDDRVTSARNSAPEPKPAAKDMPQLDRARELVRDKLAAGEVINRVKLSKEHGIAEATITRAIATERGRIEAERAGPINPSGLNKKEQASFAALEKRLRAQIADEISLGITRHINDYVLPHYGDRLRKADMLASHKMPFTNAEYLGILGALHEDTTTPERRQAAFAKMKDREVVLRSETRPSKLSNDLPKTLAELMAMRKTKTKPPPKPRGGRALPGHANGGCA